MGNKGKKKLLPAVIALLGVEHAPGSLPSGDEVAKDANKLYEINLTKAKEQKTTLKKQKFEQTKTSKQSSKTSLYNRKSKITPNNDIKQKSELLRNNLAQSVKNKRIVKKIKEVQIPVGSKRLAALRKAKQVTKKAQSLKSNLLNKTYKVKEGDNLSKIASKYNISVKDLLLANNLDSTTPIKVGQVLKVKKVKYKKSRVAKRIALIKSKRLLKNGKKSKNRRLRTLRVTATAYTSHRGQTDSTPFLAAWNNRIRPGMKIIAVSPDLIKKYGLTNGVKVKLKGLPGYYVVRDKMNKRLRNRIDIYMGLNKRKALRWGKRKIVISWYK